MYKKVQSARVSTSKVASIGTPIAVAGELCYWGHSSLYDRTTLLDSTHKPNSDQEFGFLLCERLQVEVTVALVVQNHVQQ